MTTCQLHPGWTAWGNESDKFQVAARLAAYDVFQEARELHAAAVEAKKAWEAAWKAIPRLGVEQWEQLPEKPGKDW